MEIKRWRQYILQLFWIESLHFNGLIITCSVIEDI